MHGSSANSSTFQVATPSDTEIVMTRLFDAPRALVFEVMTRPEHVRQWWGQLGDGYSVPICEIDLRVGGSWRFVNKHPRGEVEFHGQYREISPPDRLVYTEIFAQYPDVESLVTTILTEEGGKEGGKTRMTATVRYPSRAVRDTVLKSGMEQGTRVSYDRLEDVLAKLGKLGPRRRPPGYTGVTPWIISRDTAALLDFVKKAFDASELARMTDPSGAIVHAEFRIDDAIVMAFDSRSGWQATPSFLRLYVDDCDAVFQRAVAAGASAVTSPTTLSFGDRVARVADPLRNVWWIQSHLEDVTPEQMQARAADAKNVAAMSYVQESLDHFMAGRRQA
jgi:uncharacterized protein YndB with AHSA1/START domain/uncharacterized glyoxalase superfamily protein PhnB